MSETRTPRKVIQIAVTSSGGSDHLFALTDDGSVWMLASEDIAGIVGTRAQLRQQLVWREVPGPPDRVTATEDVRGMWGDGVKRR